MLTLIDLDEIDEIIKQHNNKPEDRNWQKKLAYSIVEIIHWTNEADFALKISDFMFSWDKLDILKWLDNKQINSFIQSIWWISYTDQNLFELIVSSGLASSNSQARQAISSGSIYINENKITDFKYDFSNDFLDNNVLLLQKGKKNLRIINK
jgi:tyrosyl-tRNA synthetase